jgi:hypothetical protein
MTQTIIRIPVHRSFLHCVHFFFRLISLEQSGQTADSAFIL